MRIKITRFIQLIIFKSSKLNCISSVLATLKKQVHLINKEHHGADIQTFQYQDYNGNEHYQCPIVIYFCCEQKWIACNPVYDNIQAEHYRPGKTKQREEASGVQFSDAHRHFPLLDLFFLSVPHFSINGYTQQFQKCSDREIHNFKAFYKKHSKHRNYTHHKTQGNPGPIKFLVIQCLPKPLSFH